MGWADDAEVPPVQGGDVDRAEPLRDRDDDGVGGTERQGRVPLDEVGGPGGVSGGDLHQFVQPVGDVAQEAGFCPCPGPALQHVPDLGDQRRWQQERAGEPLKQVHALLW